MRGCEAGGAGCLINASWSYSNPVTGVVQSRTNMLPLASPQNFDLPRADISAAVLSAAATVDGHDYMGP